MVGLSLNLGVRQTPRRAFPPSDLLANNELAGGVSGTPGTAPTSWTQFVTSSPTTAYTLDSLYLNGYRVRITTDASERLQISQTISVSTSTAYRFSVTADVAAATTFAVQNIVNWISGPAGSAVTFEVDGSVVVGTTPITTGRHVFVAILTVAGTAGTAAARFGVGILSPSASAVDITFDGPIAVVG